MHKRFYLIIVLSIVLSTVPISLVALPGENINTDRGSESADIIKKSVEARGTVYDIRVNKSNHTVTVSAKHIAANRTFAGFGVSIDGQGVFNLDWEPTEGDEITRSSKLMRKYDAMQEEHLLEFYTYGGGVNITYDFVVPRKYHGQYLRPTLTDVDFERINRTHGRMTVTFRSDARLNYPTYFTIWTPNVRAEGLGLIKDLDENVSKASIVLPVPKGEPFEGEIRMYPRHLNGTGPIHTQYEFYGYPGQASLSQVPYEPLSSIEVRETHEYVNESGTETSEPVLSDSEYRTGIAGLASVLVVILVLGVVLSHRRREV
jgi:hypothetical protein